MLRLGVLFTVVFSLQAADEINRPLSPVTLADLLGSVRAKAKTLEQSTGVKDGYRLFLQRFQVQPAAVPIADYSVARLLYEATRDAGLWNLHWVITNQPPNSDAIWRQWKTVKAASPAMPTAIAECDELSALYAFLMMLCGQRNVGLFWPTSNHTIAVWVLSQPGGRVRVNIPTTQIFLDESDYWGTPKFDPWRQKAIYAYSRHDVPNSFELPGLLAAFFLRQIDKYGGASDGTLQLMRYWREAVLMKAWTPQDAAREATGTRSTMRPLSQEDQAALETFAREMQAEPARR